MEYRIALEMVNNDLEPTPENIELTFKNILKRKSKTIEKERGIVRSLLKPEIMAKVDRRVKSYNYTECNSFLMISQKTIECNY